MKSMAIPILSHLKLSSQLFIEENYLLRNTIQCSCKGKCGPLSDHMNSHFCINPMGTIYQYSRVVLTWGRHISDLIPACVCAGVPCHGK